jgi:DNA-binding response OmpR family regulator
LKLLLIVDSPEYSKFLSDRLSQQGFRVVGAENVSHAMELLAAYRHGIKAVLANIEESDRMALDLCAAVQSLGFEIPFFLLTSNRHVNEARIVEYGGTLVCKPIRVDALAAAIKASVLASKTSSKKAKEDDGVSN